MSLIDISIITSKGAEKFILPCLESLYKNFRNQVNVYVTSNLASQEIINQIKSKFPKVNLVINNKKKGFAENHNNIIEKTNGKYVLVLNDDIVILNNAIEKLINYMEKNDNIAVISPQLLNPDLSIQNSTYNFPNFFTTSLNILGIRKFIPFNRFTYKLAEMFLKKGSRFWEHNEITEVDTMRGACVLIRRSAIKEVGLMDEVSLAYGEETEWHYRFRKKDWKIVFYPEAKIIHYGQQTTKSQSLWVKEESIKGLLNFYRKHKSKFSYYFLRAIIMFTSFFLYLLSLITLQKKSASLHFKLIKITLNPNKAFCGKRIFY